MLSPGGDDPVPGNVSVGSFCHPGEVGDDIRPGFGCDEPDDIAAADQIMILIYPDQPAGSLVCEEDLTTRAEDEDRLE